MDNRTLGHFFVTVVQAILLFGSDMWVATPHIKRILGGFHHRVARWISGKIPRRREEGVGEYPPLEYAMRVSGLEEIETYISRRKNKVAKYIATHPIMNL